MYTALKWIAGTIAFFMLYTVYATNKTVERKEAAAATVQTIPSIQQPTAADIYYATPRNDNWAEQQRAFNSIQRQIDRPVSCSVQVLRTRSTVQYIRSC